MMIRAGVLLLVPLLLLGCSEPEQVQPEPDPAVEKQQPPADRVFGIRYVVELTDLPKGERLRLWIPVPSDDPHQSITSLVVESPLPHRLTRDSKWGNRMVYIEGIPPEKDLTVTLRYQVQRRENRTTWPKSSAADAPWPDGLEPHHKSPSSLVVVTEEIRAEARKIMDGLGERKDLRSRARAFYDHVLAEMEYDKTEAGWGLGDSARACDVGKGNCTDYHSYFMALCLVADIPSRFQIGLFGSYERKPGEEYELGGYHCWAEFALPGIGWIPVDISEADKDPNRDFFGDHSDNRVTLSTGRDLMLEPPQAGDPLNYFVNPYAELQGKPFTVSKRSWWRDSP